MQMLDRIIKNGMFLQVKMKCKCYLLQSKAGRYSINLSIQAMKITRSGIGRILISLYNTLVYTIIYSCFLKLLVNNFELM